jgi:hypothetical protein
MNFASYLLSCLPSTLVLLDGGNGEVFTESMKLMQKVTGLGGGLWSIWGLIVLAGGLKDKNGPALQSGIWQLVGGALIIIAATMFGNVTGF